MDPKGIILEICFCFSLKPLIKLSHHEVYLYGFLMTPPLSHVSGSSVPRMTASLGLNAGAHLAEPGTEQDSVTGTGPKPTRGVTPIYPLGPCQRDTWRDGRGATH